MWTETYVAIYQAKCNECGKTKQGWFYIKDGSHDNGSRCVMCHDSIEDSDAPWDKPKHGDATKSMAASFKDEYVYYENREHLEAMLQIVLCKS